MELDRSCQNCSSFFQDDKDLRADMYLGVCVMDEAFQPFLDAILEAADFSSCYDIYQKKRYDGRREACAQYEEPEIIEIPEGEDIEDDLHIEHMKHQNVDEIIKYFYDAK